MTLKQLIGHKKWTSVDILYINQIKIRVVILRMRYEDIIEFRKNALVAYFNKYESEGYLTQEQIYREFYNTINYHPTDNYGRPIIVHNIDVINQGCTQKKIYCNLTEEYQLSTKEEVETYKIGVTTYDEFILPGTQGFRTKYKKFSKFKEYNISGLQCIILEMQNCVNYRARADKQTVVEVVFLVATTFPSMVNGVEIPKNAILKLHYTEVSRINGLKEIHKTFLDIYPPNGGEPISLEDIEIK